LAYDRAISKNGSADTSSARSSMADVHPRAMHTPRARGSEREGMGNALVLLGLAKCEREQQGGAEGMDVWRFGGGAMLAWSPHAWPRVVLWSKNVNRWWAVKWTVWSPNLGLLRAKSRHGLITRIAHLLMLYNLCEGT
jgi:hypothetical protein